MTTVAKATLKKQSDAKAAETWKPPTPKELTAAWPLGGVADMFLGATDRIPQPTEESWIEGGLTEHDWQESGEQIANVWRNCVKEDARARKLKAQRAREDEIIAKFDAGQTNR